MFALKQQNNNNLPGLRFVVTENLISFDEIKLAMTLKLIMNTKCND